MAINKKLKSDRFQADRKPTKSFLPASYVGRPDDIIGPSAGHCLKQLAMF